MGIVTDPVISLRVLVIEPDDAERGRIAAALSGLRLQPSVFSSVADATDALEQGAFGLAVISYEGPGCGLPLAMRFRKPAEGSAETANCVVVSSQVCATLTKAAQDLGLAGVIEKPVTARKLAAAVEATVVAAIARGAAQQASRQ